MAMEAPARLSLTNDAPLAAAPVIAARPVTDAPIASLWRARIARVSTLSPATSRSVPRAAWAAKVAGWLVSTRPSAVASPCPWSVAGTRTYRLTQIPRIIWAMSITQMPRLFTRSAARRRPRRCAADGWSATSWSIAGSVFCMDYLQSSRVRRGLPAGGAEFAVAYAWRPVSGTACSGEKVVDGRAEDVNSVLLSDLAGPDPVGAGVHERDGRCHQPSGGQVAAEGPVGPSALQQRANGLVRGLVGPRDSFRIQKLGHGSGHRLVPRQMLPRCGEHPVQRLDGRALLGMHGLQGCHGAAHCTCHGRLEERFPGREVRVDGDARHARLCGNGGDARVTLRPQQFLGRIQDRFGVPPGDLALISGSALRRHLSAPPRARRPPAGRPGPAAPLPQPARRRLPRRS